jgi:D-3-phosphoglycerate dehydrogenase
VIIITVSDTGHGKKMGRVAISIRSFDLQSPAMETLRKKCEVAYINSTGKRLSEPELRSILSNVDGVIAGTEKISESVMKSAPRLKVISRVGVGLDSIDMDAAEKYHILVKNTPEAPALSVAEHTLGLIFSILKNIPRYNEQVHSGDYSLCPGSLLLRKKVGIIGLGRIGVRVARMLECMGCSIFFFDPFIYQDFPASWKKMDTLESLMENSDIVSLHSGPPADSKPIIEEKLLSHAKKGLIIINTARGTLLDEQALINCLENGRVAAAGLDVFSFEPYDGNLLKYPQVIVTPHVASNTIEARTQMEREAVDNLIEGLKGRS